MPPPFYRLALIFAVMTFCPSIKAEPPLYLTYEIKKEIPIADATTAFNAIVKDWMAKHGVTALKTVELSNALALGGDSHLDLEHPGLAALSRRCFKSGSLPRGTRIILKNGAWTGESEGEAALVPMVYIFVFITTRPDANFAAVPSPEQSAECRWLPVRLTVMPGAK
ncbi:hypothetical protein [Verrucomicrobium sp. BvORR034]|uniref:hypothetical protein n=1 Tax=Verrucomicrobium sp. BvORR034 TaxID=1396418 RepID=UPI00224104F7|nr:hypothetical protein [Verrucomicrobium sp. BvORR034]